MVGRLFLGLAIATSIAHASPRTDPTSGRAVFTGATLPTPQSITLNPAAVGLGQTTEMYFGLSSVIEQFGIDRKIMQADGTLVDGPNVDDVEAGAGASYAILWHPGRITTLGAELKLPPPELFPNDPALRYHSLRTRQYDFIASGGVGFRVSGSFFFGFSVSHDVSVLRLRYDRDTALTRGLDADCDGAPCGIENPLAAEHYNIYARSNRVSVENLVLNLGILAQLAPGVWFGASYHNTPGFGIQTELHGTGKVTLAPRDGGELIEQDATVLVSFPASVDGEIRARVLPDLDFHLGGHWVDLSRMEAYDVRLIGLRILSNNIPEWTERPRAFRDAFSFWLGAEQVEVDQSKRYRLGGRLGIETSAVSPSRTSPGNMSPTSLTADVGGQFRISPNWSLQLTYGLQAFTKVTAATSKYNPLAAPECEATGFDYSSSACEAVRNGFAIPSAAGDYTRFQHAIRLGLRYEKL